MFDIQSTLNFSLWVVVVFVSYGLGITQLYALYRFKSMTNLLIIKKRYPNMIISEAIVAIFNCLFIIPFWYNYLLQATTFKYIQYIQFLGQIQHISAHFIVNMEAARLWLMSFSLHHLDSCNNQKWKSQIDDSFSANDWYLLNKNKYGAIRYILIRVMIYCFIAASISTTFFIYFQLEHLHFAELIDGGFFSVPVLTAIYVYYKCPKKLKDNFYFHYEFRITTMMFMYGLILYFISDITYYLGFITVKFVLLYIVNVMGLYVPSLVSTLWIPFCVLSTGIWSNNAQQLSAVKTEMQSAEMVSQDSHTGTKERKPVLQQLRDTFSDGDKFELFVQWMYREFSSETILSFIELNQFKQYMCGIVQEKLGTQNECEFKFYDNIPKSSIIYGTKSKSSNADPLGLDDTPTTLDQNQMSIEIENDNDGYKKIARKLYKKYIAADNEFEINLSAKLKHKYIKINDEDWNLTATEMTNVFNEIIHEMFYLMIQSYTRFDHESNMSQK